MRPRRVVTALAATATLLLVSTSKVLGHEGWFVEEGQHAGEYFPSDWLMLLSALGVAMFVASVATVDRLTPGHGVRDLFEKVHNAMPAGIEWRMVAFLSGGMLVANSILGAFLAPNLILPTPELVVVGALMQALVGIFLLSQVTFVLPALAILAVALPVAVLYFTPSQLADYVIEFVTLALALIFFGMRGSALDNRLCRAVGYCRTHSPTLPVVVIRVGVGLTFVILALHHKLLSPDLALTFLDKYDLNFVRILGFAKFTNLHFVFAAGLTEVAIGGLLISGIATRLTAGLLAIFLLSTMVLLGPAELIGHLPILGIALLLVYRGTGSVSARAR